jgi:hypothetical protein
VLIDPLVLNAEIGHLKYFVNVSIGGPGLGPGIGESTERLGPWRLRNARPGEYLVQVSLHRWEASLGPSGSDTTVTFASKAVGGPFTVVTRSFVVTAR